MTIEVFFDQATYTLTYIVFDELSKECIIIDPVLNFDAQNAVISQTSVKNLISFIKQNKLTLQYILETHAHADHISGADQLKKIFPSAKTCISTGITKVQKTFKNVFALTKLATDGSQFDILLSDGDALEFGKLKLTAKLTPGHTPGCASFIIGDNVFTGDALFMPDFGTGRCDFPDGSADQMYTSVHDKLYSLPDETKVYVGHDYQPGGRNLEFQTTILDSKKNNIHIKENTTRESYVSFRTRRDASLQAPKLLLYSIQININAGILPIEKTSNKLFLKMPINIEDLNH